jgi:amino acid transporter
MIEQALKYAKLSRFSPGEGSATGWISYKFEAQ